MSETSEGRGFKPRSRHLNLTVMVARLRIKDAQSPLRYLITMVGWESLGVFEIGKNKLEIKQENITEKHSLLFG